jgi:hypothetical protein
MRLLARKEEVEVVPKLASDQEYAEANARLIEAQLALTETNKAISAICTGPTDKSKYSDPVHDAAQRFLAEGRFVTPEDRGTARTQALTDLYGKRDVLTVAINLQKRQMAAIAERFSREVCESLAPRVSEMSRRIALSAAAFSRAAAEWCALRDELFQASVAHSRLNAPPSAIQKWAPGEWAITQAATWAEETGAVTKSEAEAIRTGKEVG